jgi:hypothetical protein
MCPAKQGTTTIQPLQPKSLAACSHSMLEWDRNLGRMLRLHSSVRADLSMNPFRYAYAVQGGGDASGEEFAEDPIMGQSTWG